MVELVSGARCISSFDKLSLKELFQEGEVRGSWVPRTSMGAGQKVERVYGLLEHEVVCDDAGNLHGLITELSW